MARILVFGGGGWVGQALLPVLARSGHATIAPRQRECDVADERAVRSMAATMRPGVVVNLAAAMAGDADEARMRGVNEDGARNAALAAAEAGARLVHLSSDAVLDGSSPPYRDDAPARPVNVYGRTKAAGELAALAACADAVAVRTSLVFDPNAIDPSTSRFASRLAAGEPCRLFVDEIRCPIPRAVLAAALVELAFLDVRGTLNVAGTEPISRFEFGALLLERFGIPGRERIERTRAAESTEPRPRDLTLDVSRARSLLATPLPGVREALNSGTAIVRPPH